MRAALPKLQQQLDQLRAAEEDARRKAAYDKAEVARSQLAAELRESYPALAGKLVDLLRRVAVLDGTIEQVNAGLPEGAQRLLGPELVARNLESSEMGYTFIPRLTKRVALPAFEFTLQQPFVWPAPEVPRVTTGRAA
jgi:hypothetical protein